MRSALIFLAVVTGILVGVVAPLTAAPAGAEPPDMPDLRGYAPVSPDPFLADREVYFQTPDGLLCAILPERGTAGCDGQLPGTLRGVNEIVLTADVNARGLRATANPRFVKTSGGAAPVLHEGQKIVFDDFVCATGPGPRTACTKGSPTVQWMVVSPGRTGIGPATEGLPPGFADPNDFVVGDETYVVGTGAKNLFPVFTVDGGLTCSIVVYSGGEIGCDGTLPGVTGGENEVFTQLPGASGVRRADQPRFTKPAYPGPIVQLPAGYRINGIGSTCMAITGGVACYGTVTDAAQGFTVSPRGDDDVRRILAHTVRGRPADHREIQTTAAIGARASLVAVISAKRPQDAYTDLQVAVIAAAGMGAYVAAARAWAQSKGADSLSELFEQAFSALQSCG